MMRSYMTSVTQEYRASRGFFLASLLACAKSFSRSRLVYFPERSKQADYAKTTSHKLKDLPERNLC